VSNGVGIVTVSHYAKSMDYAVVALLIATSAIVTYAATRAAPPPILPPPRRRSWLGALIIFLVMFFIHDHPYVVMDPFHEGEHLTPAFLFRDGARPYTDVFVLHGLAYDGGLDALVLGDPPSPLRTRRLETILDAATLAMLAPIAAELCATAGGAVAAALIGLCAIGAGQVPVFPYYRFAPIYLAILGILRYARTGRGLFLAFAASTLGILWSLDTGMYALAATVLCIAILRPPLKRVAIFGAIAIALPIVILIALRADLWRFANDSFVIIPRSIDAIWSLPARKAIDWESARYYIPPMFFGWLLAGGIKRRDPRAIAVAIFSIIAFRSAAGRCSWSHTRYGTPLFGTAIVAFLLEPLLLKRRWVATVLAAIPILVLVELEPNAVAAAKFIASWKARQKHVGLVPYPVATGRGIYTTPADAQDLAALNAFVTANAAPGAPILDVANERALYYLLQRRPPIRCFDVPFLSSPPLMREAMEQLQRNPPAVVIVEGLKAIADFDGVPNRDRVPWLFAWIDQNYPRRTRIGRFVVATK
jgi:hypothetical protein